MYKFNNTTSAYLICLTLGFFLCVFAQLVTTQYSKAADGARFVPTSEDSSQTQKLTEAESYFAKRLYPFMLGLVGISAFVMIIIGGIRYASGGWNPSELTKAKDIIWNAIFGIVLAGSSFLILRAINPDLTVIKLPSLEKTKLIRLPTGTVQRLSPEEICAQKSGTYSNGTCTINGIEQTPQELCAGQGRVEGSSCVIPLDTNGKVEIYKVTNEDLCTQSGGKPFPRISTCNFGSDNNKKFSELCQEKGGSWGGEGCTLAKKLKP